MDSLVDDVVCEDRVLDPFTQLDERKSIIIYVCECVCVYICVCVCVDTEVSKKICIHTLIEYKQNIYRYIFEFYNPIKRRQVQQILR